MYADGNMKKRWVILKVESRPAPNGKMFPKTSNALCAMSERISSLKINMAVLYGKSRRNTFSSPFSKEPPDFSPVVLIYGGFSL
jgi:hypothetical protein